jgi:AAA ATPase domain
VLERLELENFRGFEEHSVPLRRRSVIVGANNAGKSTVVEALRLVALVVNRLRVGTSAFSPIPDWLDDPRAFPGVQPARRERRQRESEVDREDRSTFFLYNDPPAVLSAHFSGGASINVVDVVGMGDVVSLSNDSIGSRAHSLQELIHAGTLPNPRGR